jgi:hypothetical protein
MTGRRSFVVLVAAILVGSAVGPAFAATGRQAWAATYGGSNCGGSVAGSTAVDPDSGVVYALSQDGQCLGGPTRSDLTAYSATGDQLWTVNSGGTADYAVQVAVDPTSHDVLAAEMRSVNDVDAALLLQAWSSSGHKLWGRTYGISNTTIEVNGLVVDDNGRAFVGATSLSNRGQSDFVTSGYLVSSGATLWHTRYDDPAHDYDQALALAVDSSDQHLYVTGVTTQSGDYEETTIAYAPGNGGQLWLAHASEDTDDNEPMHVVIDPTSHDVYALSLPDDRTPEIDIHAYTPSGALAWRTNSDVGVTPTGIVEDPHNGQIDIAGRTDTSVVLVAFSKTGARRWSKTVPLGPSPVVRAPALDPVNHRTYLTAEETTNVDSLMVTLAYTSTGVQAWRAVHRSPIAHTDAVPFAITVDAARKHTYVIGGDKSDAPGDGEAVTIAYRS